MNVLCSAEPCPIILNATCVHYEGGNLVYTGINTNDNLQVALEKIDSTIQNLIITGPYVPLTRLITINGVAQDLSADRTWTVGNVFTSGSYANPSWITSLAWSKIVGAPVIPSFTPSALTGVNDTNVTLTLGGTPGTALLESVSLTLGWTGTLPITRGGTGLNVLGTANQQLRVNAGGTALEYFTPVAGTGTVTQVDTTGPITGGPITTTGTIGITQATASTDGYLSSTDWSTFNNKFTLPSLTAGSVLFYDGTTIAQDNANFFWDNGNDRLGIGTATPSTKLEIISSGSFAKFTQTAGTNTNALIFGHSTSSYIDLYGASAERKMLIGNGGTGYADFITYNTNTIRIGVSGTLPSILTTFVPDFTFAGGTNTHTIVDLYPNINITGGTNTLRGVYYRPNTTAGSPNTHIAWENTSGDIIHGNLATGGADEMVTVDSIGKLKKQVISSGIGGSGTANEIAYFTASTTLASLTTATYPSLTELSYVKGVTSAIQTQLNGKQATGNYITALTGDVTATGPGSVSATIANDAVTFAKMQNINTSKLLGRYSAGSGDVQEITISTGLSLDGSGNLTSTGSSYRTLVSLGSDQTNATNTLADITGMSFSATAGVTYRIYALLAWTQNNTTGGWRFTINGSAGAPTLVSGRVITNTAAATQAGNYFNAYDGGTAVATTNALFGTAVLEAVVTPSANETITLRFSRNAAGTLTIKAGSTLEYW